MAKVTINRQVDAEQWLGEHCPLPGGAFLCKPEVCWSRGRELVYFTYAELLPRHWIDAAQRPLPAPEKLGFMCSGLSVKLKDGTEYWRQAYPFAFWSVKSEASAKDNHRPVYLEKDDEALVRTFLDYCDLEGWTNPLPPRAEFRITDGAYGRGFKPIYLSPGDWLLTEPGTDGAVSAHAVSNAEFEQMRARS